MSNPSLVHRDDSHAAPTVLATMTAQLEQVEVDDDENAADLDDEDELAPAYPERWAAYPGFGSPQWWARS